MAFITDNIESEGYITASTITATTIFGNGSNITNLRDTYITGVTVNNTNRTYNLITNSGSTVSFNGLTDVFVTGSTLTRNSNLTTLNFLNSTGGTFSTSSIFDTFVTGGTYNAGTIVFTNNSGNTFNVTGLPTGTDTFVTAFTYSNNTFSIKRNLGQPDLNVTVNTVTGLTVNGTLAANSLSGDGTSIVNVGLRMKSGTVPSTGFTGNPKKAIVTFVSLFSTSGFSISVMAGDNRNYTYESKTISGFTINANANQSITQPVLWTAMQHGEY